MKNNICIYFLALGAMICSINSRINAQEANRDIAGIYNTGGVGLIVAPDSIFAIAAMGTLEFGTWDVYKNYLILEPAGNLFPERFYVTAVYNAERVDIEVEFRDLSDVNGHYSFDNEELKEEMKPGYSAYSFFRLTENFPSGTHRTLQLSQKSYWDTLQENEALTYNFILPEEYNEFTVHVIEETPNLTYPFLLTIEEDALSIEGQEL
ncbi:MAG: hypothetical protein LIO77_04535, partial [Rikenellaceae bacterium]|nr:hypothetical protein [Rikenellaceae bacterium]